VWRIGVLAGTGTVRKRTVPALRQSAVCRVTVLHGRDPKRLAEIAEIDGGIRLTQSVAEFAQWHDQYDIVYVGSPPFVHREHIELAARLRKPVICEKPLGIERNDVAAIHTMIDEYEIPFMLAHQVRHQPAAHEMRQIVRGQQLGQVSAASLRWAFWMKHDASNASWKLDPQRGGSSVLFDSGVHAIDLSIFLFGAPCGVVAVGNRQRESASFDSVTMILQYSTFAVSISASRSASAAVNDAVLGFTDGGVRAPAMLGEESVPAIEVNSPNGTDRRTYPAVNLYRAEVEDFCQALDGGPVVGTTIAEAVLAARVLFAAEDAIATGRVITLTDDYLDQAARPAL
jgi:predicted dehydrogenase